jgi:hypothetical protein
MTSTLCSAKHLLLIVSRDKKKRSFRLAWWHTTVTPATWKVAIGRVVVAV